jgi:hypothetical protein
MISCFNNPKPKLLNAPAPPCKIHGGCNVPAEVLPVKQPVETKLNPSEIRNANKKDATLCQQANVSFNDGFKVHEVLNEPERTDQIVGARRCERKKIAMQDVPNLNPIGPTMVGEHLRDLGSQVNSARHITIGFGKVDQKIAGVTSDFETMSAPWAEPVKHILEQNPLRLVNQFPLDIKFIPVFLRRGTFHGLPWLM